MSNERIAKEGLVFRTLSGSRLYGINTEDSDYDYLGAAIEPVENVVGFSQFDQWVKADKTETIYSLRKLCGLILKGNPTVTELLWAPESYWTTTHPIGLEMVKMREMFISQRTLGAYLGYLREQKQRLLGLRGQKNVKRQYLVEQYGYDTKYAMHMVRLGMMGLELALEGRITLPMATSNRVDLLDIRKGLFSLDQILSIIEWYEGSIDKLRLRTSLPENPKTAEIEAWLVDAYQMEWDQRR